MFTHMSSFVFTDSLYDFYKSIFVTIVLTSLFCVFRFYPHVHARDPPPFPTRTYSFFFLVCSVLDDVMISFVLFFLFGVFIVIVL